MYCMGQGNNIQYCVISHSNTILILFMYLIQHDNGLLAVANWK